MTKQEANLIREMHGDEVYFAIPAYLRQEEEKSIEEINEELAAASQDEEWEPEDKDDFDGLMI